MLIDTSVWVEYFAAKSALSKAEAEQLQQLVLDGKATTLKPILAELRSGPTPEHFFSLFEPVVKAVDPDWNADLVWRRAAALGRLAFAKRLKSVGLVDRLIVAAAQLADEPIWTLDASCRRIAILAGVRLQRAP